MMMPMAREATGVLLGRAGQFSARIRVSPTARPVLAMHPSLSQEEAQARCGALASMAVRLRKAGMVDDAPRALKRAAATRPGKEWSNACEMVDALCGGTTETVAISDVPTVPKFAELWTTGELARRYPDQVRPKDTSDRDEQRFRLYINPVLQDVRVDRFTLDHADAVVATLPNTLRPKTRQQIKQALATLIGYAVYPARIIGSNPIPPRWARTADEPKAKSYLYPSEDRALLECPDVPLRDRLVYGFLSREGCRRGEALSLRWRHLNLEVGSLALDTNKTDEPRAWALDPGVARALTRWKERYRPDAEPGDLVFLDDAGHLTETNELRAGDFRAALKRAGVDRGELFEDTATRQPIRVHDLRSTFVTVALATGKTESWVADRTGHTSSVMINRYRRAARTHAELNLGPLAALDEAIPELRAEHPDAPPSDPAPSTQEGNGGEATIPPGTANGHVIGHESDGERADIATPRGLEPRTRNAWSTVHRESPVFFDIESTPEDPGSPPCVQSDVQSDPLEHALASALTVAATAGDMVTVARIVELLHARRREQAGPVVIDLARRRK